MRARAACAPLRKRGGEFARRANRDAASNYSGCMDERCGAIETAHRSRSIRSMPMNHTTQG
ncbi:hypothetical protein A8H35_28355 [Burkholderia thailandensis]|uniref:Uncharacterized protein n=1 Tax=Burkholderia thailandensis (strain ATCC 700388 / DSM 13276 / CCUG 48851 / CIP 106301 / E264) TaxID=271848 RepID=Q2T795_BURTA|nr:hypothetical protein BTH_II0757 [Burkholderia thailandensis E264]AOJ47807.1 hypothetical protein WJ27_21865 [Burkholderia thailandensis]AVR06611.1 hypothetical protein A8H31_03000 [Burkholderia thailandensis]AWY61955.1 hypothetical protein A8H35_28355 [Burkholderia thailandensis]AWY63988.1 hypothetical protein A8H36_00555 [Burkholderia thailandensis]